MSRTGHEPTQYIHDRLSNHSGVGLKFLQSKSEQHKDNIHVTLKEQTNPGFVHTLHCGPSDMRDKVNIHVCLKISGAVNDISSVWGFLLYISSCVVS